MKIGDRCRLVADGTTGKVLGIHGDWVCWQEDYAMRPLIVNYTDLQAA